MTRRICDDDARQRKISLTSRATPLIEEVHRFMITQQSQLESYFSKNEIDNFEKILNFFINDTYVFNDSKRKEE